MLKRILLIGIVISAFINSNNLFAKIETNLPLKKPLITKNIINNETIIDILKPLKKPTKTKKISNQKIITDKKIINFQIPKKKPSTNNIVKNSNIQISKYYNKKDFGLAKKAITEMEKGKWVSALKTA